jgi:hypothetical protein
MAIQTWGTLNLSWISVRSFSKRSRKLWMVRMLVVEELLGDFLVAANDLENLLHIVHGTPESSSGSNCFVRACILDHNVHDNGNFAAARKRAPGPLGRGLFFRCRTKITF